eukprot:1588275-Alexandrium_andersonii.AAC.1
MGRTGKPNGRNAPVRPPLRRDQVQPGAEWDHQARCTNWRPHATSHMMSTATGPDDPTLRLAAPDRDAMGAEPVRCDRWACQSFP